MKKITQEQQVIQAMRREGGFATLRKLYQIIDFSTWHGKTPQKNVNRIVQESKAIFRIQPGLWALEEMRDTVLKHFELRPGNKKSEEQFTHGYYQGLLVEIGKYRHLTTYVPAQDQNRLFIGQRLGEITDTTELPSFTYDRLLRRAKSVDVIWFNERKMPSDFFEVEHTTDIKNSLSKFYELQDFHSDFFIVADASREKEFEDNLHVSLFNTIEERVQFIDYERVTGMYEGLTKAASNAW